MPLDTEQTNFLRSLDKSHIHGRNILAKADKPNIETFYMPYVEFVQSLSDNLEDAVCALNNYKDFVSEHNSFTSQSKFAPTIIEEFICQILKMKFGNHDLLYGNVKAYSSLYFSYSGAEDFKNAIELRVNEKNQDVGIYKKEVLTTTDGLARTICVPLVCIECKTYLDKTMYEGLVATAAKIKNGNPHCLFFIVAETYEVASDVDIAISQIDNIYVLRKQRRNPEQKPIQFEVVQSMMDRIEHQFTHARKPVDEMISERGYICEP